MADIKIPYVAATGEDKTPTEEVNQSFFTARAPIFPQNSGAALNGSLQTENLDMVTTYENFKSGAFSQAGALGTTDNQDYFPDVFPTGQYITTDPKVHYLNFVNETSFFLPIPGLNRTFYNPYENALVIFTWNMSLAIDGWADKTIATDGTAYAGGKEREHNKLGAWVIFKMTKPDGTVVDRGVNDVETAFRTVLPKTDKPAPTARRGAQNDLYYSGHMTLDLSDPGWYTAGLHLGFAGPQKTPISDAVDSANKMSSSVDYPLYYFVLQDSGINESGMRSTSVATGAQDPHDYEMQELEMEQDYIVYAEGIRQARVRVRSIRHILFKL